MTLQKESQDEWVLLKNVGEGCELDIITSFLSEQNIPVQKKSRGSGAYTNIFMGMSITGYDIYVPANRLSEAKEVLESIKAAETELNEEEEKEIGSETSEAPGGYILRSRSFFKKLFIIFFVIPSLLGLLYVLFQMLQKIFS